MNGVAELAWLEGVRTLVGECAVRQWKAVPQDLRRCGSGASSLACRQSKTLQGRWHAEKMR